jgi:nicotinate-nucleotide pyrophosphorylase (carboxylating)
MHDFAQIDWDAATIAEARKLIELAAAEDLGSGEDVTSCAIIPEQAKGAAVISARSAGVVVGLRLAQLLVEMLAPGVKFHTLKHDGDVVEAKTTLAELDGNAREMLRVERPLLNFLGHLSGIATLTRRYVERIRHTRAKIYDTRKTLPGYRRLEKYAVRLGGGHNHRTSLADAILIKDNHLALGVTHRGEKDHGAETFCPARAVREAREYIARQHSPIILEIELDSLDPLVSVLAAGPDVVLLDNMRADKLARAVEIRNAENSEVQLEASGGVHWDTIAALAESGVDRISVGSLTHSAKWWDVGLDWLD